MKLQRQKAGHPNEKKLGQMLSALRDFLDKRKSSGLSLQSLLDFQDEDGSFNLLDSYEVPGEVALDFCHNRITYLQKAKPLAIIKFYRKALKIN